MAYWIFQGNPKRFPIDQEKYPDLHDIDSYVKKGKIIDWNVRQIHHRNDIQVGDQVFIWRSEGDEPNSGGIIALTEVLRKSFVKNDGISAVELEVKECRLTEAEGMLPSHQLKEVPETKQMLIFRAPQLTNYQLTEEEFTYVMNYWKQPLDLAKRMELPSVEKYLHYYKGELKTFSIETDYIKESYQFFQQFRDPEFIKKMEWEDFQKIGDHVKAYRMAIARSRAFGRMNAPLEKYRDSFTYLVHGEDAMEVRIDQFLHHPDLKLFGIGVNALSEMIGHIFPEDYCIYNERHCEAVENELQIDPQYSQDDPFSQKFVKFQIALKDHQVASKYKSIVGRQTNLPINYEVDQFFSFVFEKSRILLEGEEEIYQPRYWLLTARENGRLWQEFKQKQQISIGWNELGDLRNYRDQHEIAKRLKELHGIESTLTNDSLANEQFVRDMKEGDYIFIKRDWTKLIALGEIQSPYQYDPENGEHHSYREVKWLQEGEWDVSDLPVHMNTLTDITPYEDYSEILLNRVEVREDNPS